jgi:hypothetical protein
MDKGIVLQIHRRYAIVLTPDRRFLRVPYQAGMAVGKEVRVRKCFFFAANQ